MSKKIFVSVIGKKSSGELRLVLWNNCSLNADAPRFHYMVQAKTDSIQKVLSQEVTLEFLFNGLFQSTILSEEETFINLSKPDFPTLDNVRLSVRKYLETDEAEFYLIGAVSSNVRVQKVESSLPMVVHGIGLVKDNINKDTSVFDSMKPIEQIAMEALVPFIEVNYETLRAEFEGD